MVKRVRIPTELADAVAKVLRESQSDKETFVRSTTMHLQQQQLAIRAQLDRAYDDRLSERFSDDVWTSKSGELEEELRRVHAEMASHEREPYYEQTGLQILELAQTAYSLYVTQTPSEQARFRQSVFGFTRSDGIAGRR